MVSRFSIEVLYKGGGVIHFYFSMRLSHLFHNFYQRKVTNFSEKLLKVSQPIPINTDRSLIPKYRWINAYKKLYTFASMDAVLLKEAP